MRDSAKSPILKGTYCLQEDRMLEKKNFNTDNLKLRFGH